MFLVSLSLSFRLPDFHTRQPVDNEGDCRVRALEVAGTALSLALQHARDDKPRWWSSVDDVVVIDVTDAALVSWSMRPRGPAPAFASPDPYDDTSLFHVVVEAVNQGHGVCDSQLLLRKVGCNETMLVLLGE